jgi:SH3-like domain-containing protein
MNCRSLFSAGVFAAALAVPVAASAAIATGNVHLRAGPGTDFASRVVVPAGAHLRVFGCASWCRVSYGGIQGWVSSAYVAQGGPAVEPAPRFYPRHYYPYRAYPYRYYGEPWAYGGGWYGRPGFSFGFGFGG